MSQVRRIETVSFEEWWREYNIQGEVGIIDESFSIKEVARIAWNRGFEVCRRQLELIND